MLCSEDWTWIEEVKTSDSSSCKRLISVQISCWGGGGANSPAHPGPMCLSHRSQGCRSQASHDRSSRWREQQRPNRRADP